MSSSESSSVSSQWFFPLSSLSITPSCTRSSIPLDRELYDRARGVEFLYRLGSSLQLPNFALVTAATWFHRFYMRYSLEDYHRQDVAAGCIFLSTKTEECGRKLRDIAKVYQSKVTGIAMDQIASEDVEDCQDAILVAEEALLEALCFDFVVDHPHEILINIFEEHEEDITIQELAWCIAHDSYRTILCVLFEARVIAAACYILAQKVSEGSHSASLDARISLNAPSTSLPTPPSHKPSSPDGSRFVIEHFQFNEEQLFSLAEALTILLEFYAAQDTQGAFNFLTPLLMISPPSNPGRIQIYRPLSHVSSLAGPTVQSVSQNQNGRTPDSTQGHNTPTKQLTEGTDPKIIPDP